jgi:bifunctional DNA-binding transcriptional regulator/antitoxin component of YhaV-PrlF toxin-antitoxin module
MHSIVRSIAYLGVAMFEITAKISSKNQITVLAEVRRRVGISASDTTAFVFTEKGTIEVQTPRFDLESILGSIPPLPGASPDFEREIEEATAEEIARLARRRS